jgi:predicted aldo/keto reductase-like oxidoreductase
MALESGINQVDVSPIYGEAEKRLGSWFKRHGKQFFLTCKTAERKKKGAWEGLKRSLETLHVDHFDVFQLHGIDDINVLKTTLGPGGAMEAILEAKAQGLVRFIGITGHGVNSPAVFLEALRRFDFDSILFPINFVQYANREYRRNSEELIRQCRAKDVGTMIIKSITRSPWGEAAHEYHTWYKPFEDTEMVQKSVDFALSQDITGICTAGDTRLLPLVLKACENFTPMGKADQEALIASAEVYAPLFA